MLKLLKNKYWSRDVKKERALKKYLESARENLVNEFTSISRKIKNELISDNDTRFEEIRESVDNKIDDIAKSLSRSLGKNLQNSSKIIDKSIKKLVVDLYENIVTPRVDKELEVIAEDIYKKVSEIGDDLDDKLSKKVDTSLFEGVNKELDAIRDANIELNNSLNKGVQKALSRVGNVDKKILEISEQFNKKISETEQEITQYFDEKLSLVKEETLDIADDARKYLQDLIQESRNGLLSEIRKIKDEKPVEYILESKKGKPIAKDWDSIEKDWDKKIHDKFENYKTDLRKYIVYASGGGTNATQYQDGGIMNGDLNVMGSYLSAGINLLDIFPISSSSGSDVSSLSANWENTYTIVQANSAGWVTPELDYLPLSGGEITGSLSINERLRVGYDVNNYFNITTNSTGNTTLSVVGSDAKFIIPNNVEFGANVVIPDVVGDTSFVDDVKVLGEMTVTGQPALSSLGDNHVINKSILLKNPFVSNWIPIYITAGGESPSSTAMGQTNWFVGGSLVFTTTLSANHRQFLSLMPPQYPVGSGASSRFGDAFTFVFDYDDNITLPVDTDFWWLFGQSTGNPFSAPIPTNKCIGVKFSNLNQSIQGVIANGSTLITSLTAAIPLKSEGASKQRFCFTWNGSTLFIYGMGYASFSYGSTPPDLDWRLLTTLTPGIKITTTTTTTGWGHTFTAISNVTSYIGNLTVVVDNIQFIRQAVHPI